MGNDREPTHRMPDTGGYSGKHEKPGCFNVILGLVVFVATVVAAIAYAI